MSVISVGNDRAVRYTYNANRQTDTNTYKGAELLEIGTLVDK